MRKKKIFFSCALTGDYIQAAKNSKLTFFLSFPSILLGIWAQEGKGKAGKKITDMK